MPVITRITKQRQGNRRSVFLDGAFGFGCSVSVLAKFGLREGMELSADEVSRIEAAEARQACLDAAMRRLGARPHSRSELREKLNRREFGRRIVEDVLRELERLGCVDDERYAMMKATAAAERKGHGRRRAWVELAKSGIARDVAERVLDEVYASVDAAAAARELAEKQAVRLRRLDPATARRRLAGYLQRRGFVYEEIAPAIEAVLGRASERR